jgi:mRNA-degrading endonuclease RelE of RelBE toxin-antitoxin system
MAAACIEFIGGPLAENPYRVGKPLRAPLEGLHSARRGAFRVVYRIDEGTVTVLIVTVEHRRDVYRS